MAAGQFGVTVDIPNRDEFGALAENMNRMSGDLRRLDEQQRTAAAELRSLNDQLTQASHAKSEFLARMSHELRTPLNAILGFTELILDNLYGEVPESLREPLVDIQTNGRHLLRLINDVLDLSKIEAGRMELASSDYSVNDILETVRASLRSLASEKGLDFVVSTPTDLPIAYGDGKRIAQCLVNLAGNAIKFTEGGAGRDCGRTGWRHNRLPGDGHRHRDPRGPARQRLRGVPAGGQYHQPRIRRHGTRAQHHQEVRRDAWRPHLGGEYPGSGVDVFLHGPDQGVRRREGHVSQKTVLYIEDNEFNRKIVRQLLGSTTYRLLEANDGERGVATAIDGNPTSSSWTSSSPSCRASTRPASSVRSRRLRRSRSSS